ncbi:MAG: hypothetical protein ACYC2R_11130, partial [Burkholderiales bacterium]
VVFFLPSQARLAKVACFIVNDPIEIRGDILADRHSDMVNQRFPYLSEVVKRDEAEYFQMLKRGGIVAQVETLGLSLFHQ